MEDEPKAPATLHYSFHYKECSLKEFLKNQILAKTTFRISLVPTGEADLSVLLLNEKHWAIFEMSLR